MSLERVRLQNNKLSGGLSPEFTKLPFVYFLDLSGNNLSGSVNERKWNMPELQMLNLARNGFSGELPDSFGSKELENLDLSENSFSGIIPPSFGNFSSLMQLKLSKNTLSGNIPNELSACEKLVSIDFSHNQLCGQIPSSLSQLPVLGSLDLSMNQLSGKIPEDLGKVESLVQVNISHNNFRGKLPSTGAFLAINSSAIAGNNLCGDDTITGLPSCKGTKTRVCWFFVACLLGVLVVIVFGAFIVAFVKRRNGMKVKRVESEDGTWELEFFNRKASKSLTIDDVLSCTSDESVVSQGRKGVWCKGKSASNSMQFFVKESNGVHSISTEELAEIGKLRHPNIISVIAVCQSKKAQFLVYEYIEGKDMSEAVEGLSWERRGRKAIGIAKALRYLHGSNVLAGDLLPENVMVDGKGEARLRLSFSGLPCTDTKCLVSSAYLAPETREIKEITESSDIYGFGLILIELLTGKTPINPEVGVHESIVEWARYCYSDCHLDLWIDPIIKGNTSTNPNQIVVTMNLALQCTARDPVARPSAKEIVKTLENVMRSSSCVLGFKFSSKV